MVKHIEDIAIDKSREFKRKLVRAKLKIMLFSLFPLYNKWRIERAIKKYNE